MSRFMKHMLALLAFGFVVGLGAPASAGEAQTFVQNKHSELVVVLKQPASAGRAQNLSTLLDSMFDYDKLASDSLGRHFEERSESEIKEFTDLLRKLVRRVYQKNIEKTLNYEVNFVGELAGDEGVLVRTTARSNAPDANQETISIDYRLHKKNGVWKIADVITEESSLVSNYRNQFNKTISKDGWQALIQKLKNKVASNTGT